MDAPDTSDIDLDPAHFRCRADLWYCLDRLYTKIGRPKYRKFCDEILKSKGIKLAPSTLSNLISEKSKTSTGRVTWDTVERFVRGCGVPETELEGWRKAWQASEARDKPAWQEERERLRDRIEQLTAALAASEARIEQLTADVQKAEARAVEAEKALTDRDQTQSAEPPLSEAALKVLSSKAEARHDLMDYAGAAELYKQIAERLKRMRGPGDRRALQFESLCLDAEACALFCDLAARHGSLDPYEGLDRKRPGGVDVEKLEERWRELVREHQRWLPQCDPMTLHLQLRQGYWVDTLHSNDLARRILSDLRVDCEVCLAPGDPFNFVIDEIMRGGTSGFFWLSTRGPGVSVAGSGGGHSWLSLWTTYRDLINKINSLDEHPN